jgi:hypothetical protein
MGLEGVANFRETEWVDQPEHHPRGSDPPVVPDRVDREDRVRAGAPPFPLPCEFLRWVGSLLWRAAEHPVNDLRIGWL